MTGLFTQIERYLTLGDEVSLSISRRKNDSLRVVVIPKLGIESSTDQRIQQIRAGMCAPIVVDSTPEELDQKFVGLLEEVATDRIALKSSFENSREKNDETLISANKSIHEGNASKSNKVKVEADVKKSEAPEKPKTGNSLI